MWQSSPLLRNSLARSHQDNQDDYGKPITLRLNRDLERQTLKWIFKASIRLTYSQNTWFSHTRRYDFHQEVDFKLEATSKPYWICRVMTNFKIEIKKKKTPETLEGWNSKTRGMEDVWEGKDFNLQSRKRKYWRCNRCLSYTAEEDGRRIWICNLWWSSICHRSSPLQSYSQCHYQGHNHLISNSYRASCDQEVWMGLPWFACGVQDWYKIGD